MRPVLGEVGEEMLDHRVGAAPVGAEQQRVHVAGGGAGGGGAQRLAGARPVDALEPGHIVGRGIAVDGQRHGAVGGDQLVHAGVEDGVVDHVRLAGDQHHRVAVPGRPRERPLADGAQPGVEAELGVARRRVGVGEVGALRRGVAGALRERAHGALERAQHPRCVEAVALLFEEYRAQHPGRRSLGGQRPADHVRGALRHRAGVRLGAGVRQRRCTKIGARTTSTSAPARPWSSFTGAHAPGAAQRRSPSASVSRPGRRTSTR